MDPREILQGLQGAQPMVVQPALLQLGNFLVNVEPYDGEGANHMLVLCAKNGAVAFTVPLPEEAWEDLAGKIERRNSPIVIPPTNGGSHA